MAQNQTLSTLEALVGGFDSHRRFCKLSHVTFRSHLCVTWLVNGSFMESNKHSIIKYEHGYINYTETWKAILVH